MINYFSLIYFYVIHKITYFFTLCKFNQYYIYDDWNQIKNITFCYYVFTCCFLKKSLLTKIKNKKYKMFVISDGSMKDINNFERFVPKKPILKMYLIDKKDKKIEINNVKKNMFKIHNKLPLSIILKYHEHIDIKQYKDINIKYIDKEKKYRLNDNLTFINLL